MSEHATTGGMTIRILLIVLIGAPMVGWLWETLNRLFSGLVEPARLLISIPVAVAFWLLLRALGRTIERWADARDVTEPGAPHP